nr:hypothetical protein [uncultured Dongia sp.]
MNDEARLVRDLLFLSMAAAVVIGLAFVAWKRGGKMPFGRVGAITWVCAAAWIVLWLTSRR